MDAIIISAVTKDTQLLSKIRTDILAKAFTELGLNVLRGVGQDSALSPPESVLMIVLSGVDDDLVDQAHDLARLMIRVFDQAYFIRIQNDSAYRYPAAPGVCWRLGTWWDTRDPSCPAEVRDEVNRGVHTTIGQTRYGIFTQAMADRRYPAPNPLSFGSPEYLERQANLARHYPY